MSARPPLVEVDALNGVAVARLRGELDAANTDAVERALAAAQEPAPRSLVVDLSEATFLDSAMIALLFKLARRLRARRERIALVSPPSSPIRGFLGLSGLSTVTEVADSVDDALRFLRDQA